MLFVMAICGKHVVGAPRKVVDEDQEGGKSTHAIEESCGVLF